MFGVLCTSGISFSSNWTGRQKCSTLKSFFLDQCSLPCTVADTEINPSWPVWLSENPGKRKLKKQNSLDQLSKQWLPLCFPRNPAMLFPSPAKLYRIGWAWFFFFSFYTSQCQHKEVYYCNLTLSCKVHLKHLALHVEWNWNWPCFAENLAALYSTFRGLSQLWWIGIKRVSGEKYL